MRWDREASWARVDLCRERGRPKLEDGVEIVSSGRFQGGEGEQGKVCHWGRRNHERVSGRKDSPGEHEKS